MAALTQTRTWMITRVSAGLLVGVGGEVRVGERAGQVIAAVPSFPED